jgi:hypothetical protein
MRRLGIEDVTGLGRYAVRVGLIPACIRRVAAPTHHAALQFAGD